MQQGVTKGIILARASRGPARWSELLSYTRISKPTLLQHLRELQEQGLLEKTAAGYVVTAKGKAQAEEAEVQISAPVNVKSLGRITPEKIEAVEARARGLGINLFELGVALVLRHGHKLELFPHMRVPGSPLPEYLKTLKFHGDEEYDKVIRAKLAELEKRAAGRQHK
jgi:DNA-binding MarR family transcriptional regulator